MSEELLSLLQRSRRASLDLAQLPFEEKNKALRFIASRLRDHTQDILRANECDLARSKDEGSSSTVTDRLMLDEKRIDAIACGVESVVQLTDSIGEIIESWDPRSDLSISKVRVPLGVIGVVYENRPNVTVDVAALTIKTANSVVLRGSSSALETNLVLVRLMREALSQTDIPPDSIMLLNGSDRNEVGHLLTSRGYVDVIIPRGSSAFIEYVVQHATVPIIETGAGNCHLYVHHDAHSEMATSIALNAKTQRPSVCNAIETILIHSQWPRKNKEKLISDLLTVGVTCRASSELISLNPRLQLATEEDWKTEYLDLTVALHEVTSLDEALEHIAKYSTHHSEAIITEDVRVADRFLSEVDSAVVYHNASTRFTDGGEFGFGAEIGISTQKLHARGPMGLNALTSYKYIVKGNGAIRA